MRRSNSAEVWKHRVRGAREARRVRLMLVTEAADLGNRPGIERLLPDLPLGHPCQGQPWTALAHRWFTTPGWAR